MIITNAIKKYALYLYIFYVIYTPTISNSIYFNKYIILSLLTVAMLAPYIIRNDRSIFKMLMDKRIFALMFFIFASSIYIMLVQVFKGIDLNGLTGLRIVQNNVINLIIINVAIIIDKLKKSGYSSRGAFELILKLGAVQGIFCLLSLAAPSLRSVSIQLYSATGGSNLFVINSRIYGLSSDFTYGTPIYHGLLAALAIYYGSKYKKNYYPYILLILLSAALSGRTGIILFLFVALFSIIYTAKKNGLVKMFATLLVSITGLLLVLNTIRIMSPNTYQFINSFKSNTSDLVFERRLSGNYEVLIEESLKFPVGSDVITGQGHRVYKEDASNNEGFRSDIGYVNDVYMGGIIFSLLLYYYIYRFLVEKSSNDKFILFIVFVAILLANFKGEVFRSSIVMFLIVYIKMSLKYLRSGAD
jgi:hypothetical protein